MSRMKREESKEARFLTSDERFEVEDEVYREPCYTIWRRCKKVPDYDGVRVALAELGAMMLASALCAVFEVESSIIADITSRLLIRLARFACEWVMKRGEG